MLTAKAAFVVEIELTGADSADLRGRVEHVLSGATGEFESGTDMLRFIMRVLAAPVANSQQQRGTTEEG